MTRGTPIGFATGFGGTLLAWAVGLSGLAFPSQSPQPLPYSALPLKLLGVMLDTDAPSKSACLIRCTYPVEKVATLGPGQKACDLAEVREIRQDTVVINNLLTNRLELLTFQSTQPQTTAQPSTNAQPPASTEPPPPPLVVTTPNTVTVELPKDSVNRYLENLPALLDSALATPRYREAENGQRSIEGFEISRIRTASIVEQVGLQNGDVVLELNGQKLDSMASAVRLLSQAQNMPQMTMIVLRNGQRMTFVFNRK